VSDIKFVGQVSSTYLFGRGRGKDKQKRKRRIINALKGAGLGALGGAVGISLAMKGDSRLLRHKIIDGAAGLGASALGGAVLGNAVFDKKSESKSPLGRYKAYQEKQNKKKYKSSIGTQSLAGVGAVIGAKAGRIGMLTEAANHIPIGLKIDKNISQEKQRFNKEGARSRFGKIVHDAKVGAASTSGTLALNNAVQQVLKVKKTGNIKRDALSAVGRGVAGAIYGGAKGVVIGGSLGSGVGLARGFVQPNKKKSK